MYTWNTRKLGTIKYFMLMIIQTLVKYCVTFHVKL